MLKQDWFKLTFRLPQPVKKCIPFLLFFAAIGINIYFRLFPAYFPQALQQAKLKVENRVIDEIANKVNLNYPDFNNLIKTKIILKIFEEDKKATNNFKKEVQNEYQRLKGPYQDERGQTYLLEVDGYQWMRYVENILKNGHPGDRIKDGYPYDDYMLAPTGCRVVSDQFFFYLSAYLYGFFSFFLKGISLAPFLFFLPLFFILLFLSLLYLAVRTFFSDVVAFFSVIFVGLNRVILSHTTCGWFDYDSLTYLLPLVIIWLLSLSFRNRYTIKKRLIYVLLSALVATIYAWTWIGYWWVFGIIGAYYFYIIANVYSLNRKAHKEVLNYIFLALVFFLSSLTLCSFVLKANVFKDILALFKSILHLGTSQQASIWPYTFYTVGELIKTSPEQIVQIAGGPVIVTFAMIGVLWIYIKEKRAERKDFVTLMIFWIFVMCFAAQKSFRFIAFLVIPLGVFFGVFVEYIFKYLYDKIRNKSKMALLGLAVFIIFISWSGKTLLSKSYNEASSIYPFMNDDWNKALVHIEKNTPPKSIINSWWDYGNFFKTISKRRVIFDPQSQHMALAYWMAEVLLDKNENEAINTLRMLNNSSSNLFDEMNLEIKDDFKCVVLIKKILSSDLQGARMILEKENISEELKNKIIENIFLKEPPPAYFVIDGSMIYKMQNISFLGNWSFPKVYVMKNKNLPKEKLIENITKIFSLSSDQAENIYREVILSTTDDEASEVLSKRSSFSFFIGKGKEDRGLVYFSNGVVLNLVDSTARILSQDKGYKKFKHVFIDDGKNLASYEYKDADYDTGALFLKNKNEWYGVGLPPDLAESLFIKLYFFNGAGVKYFEPFYADNEGKIYIYKIKWPKQN